jgi:hypothetical protein
MKERTLKEGVDSRLKAANERLEQLEQKMTEVYEMRTRENNEVCFNFKLDYYSSLM